MLKLIIIALIQSATLASAQVFLKLGMERVGTFEWTAAFWGKLIANWSLSWPFAACGIGYTIATLLWLYMLKVYDFSLVYPMTSLNYIFGMFGASRNYSCNKMDRCHMYCYWLILCSKTLIL